MQAHVSAAVLSGPPPTPAELLAALAWVIARHPLLAAVVRGRGECGVCASASGRKGSRDAPVIFFQEEGTAPTTIFIDLWFALCFHWYLVTGKYYVPNAQPYPLHSDYLGKAVEYTDELLRVYPDTDIEVCADIKREQRRMV